MGKSYLMTEAALAARLTEKYGEAGMTASQVWKEFRIRKSPLPDTLEYVVPPGGKRKRYAPGSVARWWTQGRVAEASW